jgi:hypothetical protein
MPNSMFLYTSNEQAEKENGKTIPFLIASKYKYLGINLIKEVNNLYNENIKHRRKK